jgi:small GTP-binding protein
MQTTYVSKVTFIGDSKSGKTSIIKRYQENQFSRDTQTTIGVDFTIKEIDASPPEQPSNLKMQIWDTAGQEKFAPIIRLYFRNSYAMVIVFDLTNPFSFEHIINWIRSVREEYEPEIYVVVGNKSDLKRKRVVTKQYIHSTLSAIKPTFNYKYIETSAKKNYNISQLFDIIIRDINEKTATTPPSLKNELSLKKVKLIYDISSSSTYPIIRKPNCCSVQ